MSDPQSGDFFSAWSEWAASGEGTGSVSRRALEEAAQAHLAPADPPRGTTATKSVTIESDPAFRGEPVTLLPGERFAGLEVRERLGGGGMATVYRAWDPEQEVEVALKLLHRGLVSDTRHLKRFRREARVASRLRHPRIVSTHTYGELGGNAYLTMHVIEGPTLEQLVEQRGPLPPLEAARIVEQVARAIDAAHSQRVVHRDLKPSNVMLHPDDGPLVLDFGLAKHLHQDPTLTETGEILGTPSYLAPEQVSPKSDPVDHRIDIYGLGGILFFLLTGKPPHEGESAIEVLQAILHREPPRLRDVLPSLPAPLEILCAKALARDPRERFLTAADFAEDLARFQADTRVRARLPGRLQRALRHVRRHPVASGLVLALLSLLVSGAFAVRALADRVVRHERSERALELLTHAEAQARAGLHDEASQHYLYAMLEAKSAFLEAPEDEVLRAALARVKRARIVYAESRGNWALAEELRQNLAQLESGGLGDGPAAQPVGECTVSIEGLRAPGRVVFFTWDGGRQVEVAAADSASAQVTLPPGSYWATEFDAEGAPRASFLVVMDPGHRHVLRLEQEAAPPPGVFRLPPGADLRRAPLAPPAPPPAKGDSP